MKNLIVGDIHGFHSNLRDFLIEQEVIDAQGNPINRDIFNVYSVGDLIDGDYNRQGDIRNMETAPEWFNAVCLGNHEYAFLGGKEFSSRRKHDRKTMRMLLELIEQDIYVPAILVAKDTLITHSGLGSAFGFETAADAYEYIRVMWALRPDLDDDVSVFDSVSYSYSTSPVCASIFQLDWTDKRNDKFSQVVGHSTYYTGPVFREYEKGIVHWNVDVGAKTGTCVGGIILDDVTGEIEVCFHGDRYESGFVKQKKTYPPKGDVMAHDPKAGKSQLQLPSGSIPVTGTPTMTNTTLNISGSKAAAGSTKHDKHFTVIANDDLSDLDIALITDPEILSVYRAEVQRGNKDLELKEMVKNV